MTPLGRGQDTLALNTRPLQHPDIPVLSYHFPTDQARQAHWAHACQDVSVLVCATWVCNACLFMYVLMCLLDWFMFVEIFLCEIHAHV